MLPKFLPFEGKYVSVGAVWRYNAPQEATRATVFSSRPHTMRDVVTIGALGGGDQAFTNEVGAISTTQLEAPNETRELHHNEIWLRGELNRLGCSNTQE